MWHCFTLNHKSTILVKIIDSAFYHDNPKKFQSIIETVLKQREKGWNIEQNRKTDEETEEKR